MSTDDTTRPTTGHPDDAPGRGGAQEAARRAAEEAAQKAGVALPDWLSQAIKEAGTAEIEASETATVAEMPAVPEADPTRASPAEEARRAAEEAAAAAGVPMSAWLGQLLKEASREEQGVAAEAEATAEGFGAPTAGSATEAEPRLPVRPIPLDQLAPSRFQMRERIDPEELAALAASVRSRGVLQPIIVRARSEGETPFEIVAGERRWRAAAAAGLGEVPALVLDVPDRDAMEIALVENLQRHDLSPLEEAEGYRRLVEDLGETQENLAQIIGKSRSHISNTLRLLRLPAAVKALLADGKLSAGHARALLAAADPEGLARRAIAENLSVRDTERLSQEAPTAERPAGGTGASKDPDLEQIEEELSRLFGVAVKIGLRGTGERGTLTIRFKGLEKLHELIERLRT
jgi:ParB family chromosome partitioning protein